MIVRAFVEFDKLELDALPNRFARRHDADTRVMIGISDSLKFLKVPEDEVVHASVPLLTDQGVQMEHAVNGEDREFYQTGILIEVSTAKKTREDLIKEVADLKNRIEMIVGKDKE